MSKSFRILSAILTVVAVAVLMPSSVYAFDEADAVQAIADLEAAQMQQLLDEPQPTPIVPHEAAPVGPTYVDVSINDQTLTYFVNGVPVLQTPCVTGSPGRGTPRGVFQINTRTPGKYLNGPTWHVWVNRWMRFAGNCGIHDATWRKQFGGDIYKHNGSHGCVNIPKDMAIQLYNMVGIGTTVIVH